MWRMSINATKWTFLVVVFNLLSFLLTFASGINIAWVERSFAHTLGFPRQASLRDRSAELSEPIVTLGSLTCTFYLCVHPPYWCAHPRLAEQNNIQSLYFFQVHTWEYLVLDRVLGVTRKNFVPQTRHVPRRDHMRQLFTSEKHRKLGEEFSFRSFHRSEFVCPVVKSTQNSVFLLQYQHKWILLQTLRLLFSWNTGFPYACSGTLSFAWNNSSSIRLFLFLASLSCFPKFLLCQAICVLDVVSSEFSWISSRVGFILSKEFRSITLVLWNPVHDSDRFLLLSTSQQS